MSISNSLLYQIHQMVFFIKAKVRAPSSFSLLFESYFWSNSRQISLPAGLISSSHITLGLSMGSHVFFFFLNVGIWWIPNHISRIPNCTTDDFTFLFAYLGNIFFFLICWVFVYSRNIYKTFITCLDCSRQWNRALHNCFFLNHTKFMCLYLTWFPPLPSFPSTILC